MKIKLDIPKHKLMFITVPDISKEYKIVNYGYAGTYLMENNSKELNAWKLKIPNGNCEVIGLIKDSIVDIDDLKEIDINKNFIIRYI